MSLEDLQAQIEEVLTRLQVSENKIEVLSNLQTSEEERSFSTRTTYVDVTTKITSGDQIQLDSYKSIPEFNGDKNQYQSWRNQVARRMTMIEVFVGHAKYEAALGIIRAKITGAASDTLTNNQTVYNIDAIIERLDASYADQRPIYIIEAEMESIKQNEKSLQEYHDAINQALNLYISKITLTYKSKEQQDVLTNHAQIKAIRTFIIGMKSRAMRNILYGGKYSTLSQVYTTAQTVHYDDQYLQLDQMNDTNKQLRTQPLRTQQKPIRFYPNVQPQVQNVPRVNVNMGCNQPQQGAFQSASKPEPMEIDSSNRFKQTTNFRRPIQQMNAPQKRENSSSRQYVSQPNKMQRVNQVIDSESNPDGGCEGDLCDTIPDDLLSNASHAIIESDNASAFLSE